MRSNEAVRAQRLHNQHLAKPRLSPADIVAAFGAMQAQEYAMAKWALGLRTADTTDDDIEQLIGAGKILRTHPLRMTHHFVTPADIRWLLALLAPIAIKRAGRRWQELGLDGKTIAKSQAVLARALEGGKHLIRAEVNALLARAGISPAGQRLPHLIGRAELDGLICSGARRGKQITIALLEERVPKTAAKSREEALAELAKRYFSTRAPATVQDFMWWSGLGAKDAREAVALAGSIEPPASRRLPSQAYLLPTYDEYSVAYRDRSAIGTPPKNARGFGESTLLGPAIVVAGEIIGSWWRTFAKNRVAIELRPWRKLTARERSAVEKAADRYAAFVGLPRA